MCEDFFPEAPNYADEFEDDGTSNELVAEDDLRDLAALANQQLELEQRVKDIEEQLANAKRDLFAVSSEAIPQRMAEIGMKEFLLNSGERIQVRRVIKASIPQKCREAAFEWLRANGFGDLVKNEVKAVFGRGEDEKAQGLLKALQGRGYNADQKESVHAGTLAAFVREQFEKGHDVPQDLLGVFEYLETKVSKA